MVIFSLFFFLFHVFEVCIIPFAPQFFCCNTRQFVSFPDRISISCVSSSIACELGPAPWRSPSPRSLHRPPASCAAVVAGLSPGLSELLGGGLPAQAAAALASLPAEAGAAACLHAQAAVAPACLPGRRRQPAKPARQGSKAAGEKF